MNNINDQTPNDPVYSLLKGVLNDVLLAERSFSLNREINTSYPTMPKGVEADISWILFDLSYTEMVLSLCRIFDTPDKKYPNRCLRQIYKVIKDSDYDIHIQDRNEVLLNCPFFDIHDIIVQLLHESSKKDFNKRAVDYFERKEIDDAIVTAIGKLKTVRDKFLAHNENVEVNTLVRYEYVEILLKHAQNAISFFYLAYRGINLKESGAFYLSTSSGKWRHTFKTFVKKQNGR
jgi:hypothetical protein